MLRMAYVVDSFVAYWDVDGKTYMWLVYRPVEVPDGSEDFVNKFPYGE